MHYRSQSRRALFVLTGIVFYCCALSAQAGNMSLVIEGIAAPVDIRAFSFGVSNSGTVLTAGKVNYQDVSFVALESAASPPQLLFTSTGVHRASAVFKVFSPATGLLLSDWTFTDVIVNSFQIGGDPAGASTSFTLNFGKLSYRVYAANGGTVAQQMCWNVATSTATC